MPYYPKGSDFLTLDGKKPANLYQSHIKGAQEQLLATNEPLHFQQITFHNCFHLFVVQH